MKGRKITIDKSHPKLLKEWDYERNWKEFGLKPEDITAGSNIKVWWVCKDHPKEDKWFCSTGERTHPRSTKISPCPFCSNRKINIRNCLATLRPDVAKHWHKTLNGTLTPYDVIPGSHLKVWWQCPDFEEDVYQAKIVNKTNNKNKCSICDGKVVNNRTCVATTHPDIIKFWHKDNVIKPTEVSFGSSTKILWQCLKYEDEKFWGTIGQRLNIKGDCVFCTGRQVNHRNCLAAVCTEIAKEWHPEKNGDLKPTDITRGHDKKIWWKCPIGHSYPAAPYERTGKHQTDCPFCCGKKIDHTNSLLALYPNVAKDWNYELNDTTPDKIAPHISDKFWWNCDKYPEEKYYTSPGKRTRKNDCGQNCPYCAGKKVNQRNCLATTDPDIASQWHPDLNGDLTPNDVTIGSGKKVWWLCKNGHKFKTQLCSRRNNGCPQCPYKNQALVYNYLIDNKFNFKFGHPVQAFKTKNPLKVDFYLPEYNLFIEYDGEQHFEPVCFGGVSQERAEKNFKRQKRRDNKLDKYCLENHINILHIDGRIYQGQKLKQYLETEFIQYLNSLIFTDT